MKSRKYHKNSYITNNQIKVLLVINKKGSVAEAAKELGVHETTIYAARRKMEAVIERAIRTLEVAQKYGLLDEDRLAGLMKDVY